MSAELAQRARADLAAGATVDDVMQWLRSEARGTLEAIAALRDASGVSLATASQLFSRFSEGTRFTHLRATDLELLAVPPPHGIDFFTLRHRDEAIVERKPWLLYARMSSQSVYAVALSTPLSALPSPLIPGDYGCRSGPSVSFAGVAAEARAAAAAWPREIAIERDEPDETMLHFVRVPLP